MGEFEETIENSFEPEYQTIDEIHENLNDRVEDDFSIGEVKEIVIKKEDDYFEENNLIDEVKGLNKVKSFIKSRFKK